MSNTFERSWNGRRSVRRGPDAAFWAWRARSSSKRLENTRQALDDLLRRNGEFLADAMETLPAPALIGRGGDVTNSTDAHMHILSEEQNVIAAEFKQVRAAINSLLALSKRQLERPDATAANLRELVKGHEADLIRGAVRKCEKLAAAFRDLISKTRAFLTLKVNYGMQLHCIQDLANGYRRVRVTMGDEEAGWLHA